MPPTVRASFLYIFDSRLYREEMPAEDVSRGATPA